MTVQIYTSRFLHYRGDDGLDITNVGHHSIGMAFAPSDGLIWPHKHHPRRDRAEWLRYREAYIAEMRVSYVKKLAAWKHVLGLTEVTLLCYCVNPSSCHRVVAAELLAKAGGKYEGER